MTILLLLGLTIGLSLFGLPLVFSILAASTVTLLVYRPGIPLEVVAQMFLSGMDSFLLLAVAFFFLAGELMNRGGITKRIIEFANVTVGHIRGGLGHVNIVSSIFFSGISGAAVADTAAIGSVMIPAMVKKGYSKGFAAAITQTSSVVGPIIPPSIPVIVYAILAQVSVGKMFLAGVIPGLVVGLFLMIAVYILSLRRDYPREGKPTLKAVLTTGFDALLALIAPLIVVGGILAGVMTATEAGAVAALYSFIIGKFVFKGLSWRDTGEALIVGAKGTATVLVIVGASALFAWIVADLQVSRQVANGIFAISREPWAVLLMVNIFILIIGLFMDPLAALVILVPIFLPAMQEIGIDPIHFGIVAILNLMIGLTTPPVGYLIYLSAYIAKTKPENVIRESLPFMAALLIALLVCMYVPEITLTLPSLYGN